jgi:hypothetical protein
LRVFDNIDISRLDDLHQKARVVAPSRPVGGLKSPGRSVPSAASRSKSLPGRTLPSWCFSIASRSFSSGRRFAKNTGRSALSRFHRPYESAIARLSGTMIRRGRSL